MAEELIFKYVEDADLLEVFVGTPRHTENYDIADFVDVRADFETGEIVGLIVRHCSKEYPNLLKLQPREAIIEMFRLMTGVRKAEAVEREPAYLLRENAATK